MAVTHLVRALPPVSRFAKLTLLRLPVGSKQPNKPSLPLRLHQHPRTSVPFRSARTRFLAIRPFSRASRLHRYRSRARVLLCQSGK